jgi:5,6-dimethylbenzimidazole synthase
MDLFHAIKERWSCRKYLSDPISGEVLQQILEAATCAPSPANNQPWEFVVITNNDVKNKLFSDTEQCKKLLLEKSGWKWLGSYKVDFLKEAPVIIAIVGNPKKTGADMFLEGGGMGYQQACSAAIQNMLLVAHALGLGSLWFTLFDQGSLRPILNIDAEKDLMALVCLGKPAGKPMKSPRKAFTETTIYLR